MKKKKIFVLVLIMCSTNIKLVASENNCENGGVIRGSVNDEKHSSISNAEFKLTDAQGNIYLEKTNDDGAFQFSCLETGEYKLEYNDNLDEYMASKKEYSFKIDENAIKELNINLTKIFYKTIKFSQFDSLGNPISGSEFTIYDSSGNAIQTISTDANGEAESIPLSNGIYYVKQTKAPPGYLIDENRYEINIYSNTKNSVEYITTSDRISVSIKFSVYLSSRPIDNINFSLYYKNQKMETQKSKNGGLVLFTTKQPGTYSVVLESDEYEAQTLEFNITNTGEVNGPSSINLYKTENDDSLVPGLEKMTLLETGKMDVRKNVLFLIMALGIKLLGNIWKI